MEDYEKMGRADALEKQVLRKWKLGDVYAPHDLSGDEMKKWGMNRPGQRDAFDVLGINPLHEYKVRSSIFHSIKEISDRLR